MPLSDCRQRESFMARSRDSQVGQVEFCPISSVEHSLAASQGVNPSHRLFTCGACGKSTQGRIVCGMIRPTDKNEVQWCLCSCEQREPTIIVLSGGKVITQN